MGLYFWNPDRLETLRAMRADGYSASLIAESIGGGCSRSAVISKCAGLKIPAPCIPGGRPLHSLRPGGSPKKPTPETPRVEKPKQPSPSPIPEVPAMIWNEPVEFTGTTSAVLELRPRSCRWPIGDARDPNFRFCGDPVYRGAYCKGHAEIAYVATIYKPRVNIAPAARDAGSAR